MLLTAPARTAGLVGHLLSPTRLGLARTGVGVVMLTRPSVVPTALGVDPASAERMDWAVQMLGAREVSLGLGAVLAGRAARRSGDARPARLWLAAGLLADAVDAVAVARAVGAGRLSKGTGGALVLIAAAAAGTQARGLSRR